MGIENASFHRRLQRKMRSKDARLAELYSRTCTVCGVQANAETGECGTCGRQVIEIEPDPVPDNVMRPVDPQKAEAQRAFYARLEKQRIEREQAAVHQPKRDVQRLPGESLPGDAPKRDYTTALRALGLISRW